MNDQINDIPPVPDHTPIRAGDKVQDNGSKVAQAWSRWFLAVRNKVNAINASLVALADVTGGGLLVRAGDDWRLTEVVGGTGVTVTGGDGSTGDIEVSLPASGVTPGAYGSGKLINITVNGQGVVTEVADGDTPMPMPTVTAVAPVGGTSTALPAQPVGYLEASIVIGGTPTNVKIPYYG